jgi:hypothetical protein
MSIQLPPKTTVGEQFMIDGLYFEWLEGGQAVALRLTHMEVATVDMYLGIQTLLLNSWDASRPYLALHDISDPNVDVNSQIRKKAPPLFQLVRQHKIFGLTVFMLNTKGTSAAAKIFINTMQRILVSDLKIQFVNDRERGITLLRQHLPKGD